jgi:hypothetical protein
MAWVENDCWGKGHLSISNRSNEYNKYNTKEDINNIGWVSNYSFSEL